MKKVAVITGAAHGIGFGVALRFAEQGYKVVIADIDAAGLMKAHETLNAVSPTLAVVTNVGKEAHIKRLFAATKKHFGGMDVLVNNAAIANPYVKPITKLSLKEWNDTLAVNLSSVFLCTKHAVPIMRPGSCIINMSSTRSIMSEPHSEIYATAKGGIDALTHALAISLGPKIRVNSIRPGWIETKVPLEELSPKDHLQHPVGRVGMPSDIAALAWFLASEGAGFITGQSFVADGGMTRKMIYRE